MLHIGKKILQQIIAEEFRRERSQRNFAGAFRRRLSQRMFAEECCRDIFQRTLAAKSRRGLSQRISAEEFLTEMFALEFRSEISQRNVAEELRTATLRTAHCLNEKSISHVPYCMLGRMVDGDHDLDGGGGKDGVARQGGRGSGGGGGVFHAHSLVGWVACQGRRFGGGRPFLGAWLA